MTTKTATKATTAPNQTRSRKPTTKETEEIKGTSQNALESLEFAIKRLELLASISFDDAMMLAQSELKNPPKTSEGKMPTKSGFYPFKFAGLDVISKMVREACNKYGLFITQPVTSIIDDNGRTREYVHTIIKKNGEEQELAKMELDGTIRDEKKKGGQITYFQRQQLKAVFVIAGDDDISDQSGEVQNEIPDYYPASNNYAKNKEDNETREYEELVDLKDEITERATTAKALGLKEEAYKKWFKANIRNGWASMTIVDAKAVLEYLNGRIADLKEVHQAVEPDTETIPY